jgi:hypothetical protein
MNAIFKPAVALLRLMNYPYKLGLVSLFFVLPIVVLLAKPGTDGSSSRPDIEQIPCTTTD